VIGASLTVFASVDHCSAEGQVELSRDMQIIRAAYDAPGLSVILLGSTGSRPELLTGMLNAANGTQLEPTYLPELGRQVLDLEQRFNYQADLSEATDHLPEFFAREPLPLYDTLFEVPEEDLAGMWAGD
jgi:aldehyde:ferredoxin oxidoreductase